MRKMVFLVAAAVALALVLAVPSALVASNMGFKLNYQLNGAGAGSFDGTNTLGLPFNPQAGITDAATLLSDIETSTGVDAINVQRFRNSDNGLDLYTGARGSVNFPVVEGEGYRVRMSADTSYIIVGSHNPSAQLNFSSAGFDGTNTYSYPYHSTATTAAELYAELGPASVINLQALRRSDNGLDLYTGARGGVNFALEPGKSYRVRVNTDILNYQPSHY